MASLETNLTLIGGPTVLIELSGLRLLTDPTFDEPGSYEARGIVLEKKSGPAFSSDKLGAVDAVLLSQDQHFDNLDRAGSGGHAKGQDYFHHVCRCDATRRFGNRSVAMGNHRKETSSKILRRTEHLGPLWTAINAGAPARTVALPAR